MQAAQSCDEFGEKNMNCNSVKEESIEIVGVSTTSHFTDNATFPPSGHSQTLTGQETPAGRGLLRRHRRSMLEDDFDDWTSNSSGSAHAKPVDAFALLLSSTMLRISLSEVEDEVEDALLLIEVIYKFEFEDGTEAGCAGCGGEIASGDARIGIHHMDSLGLSFGGAITDSSRVGKWVGGRRAFWKYENPADGDESRG
ncbi:hypothetical protein BDP27DRAFT_1368675 [Rhodocollybia butyracea]|uniref:Uncharacterized protein n=1 Tax=Rhodocollybia butyracea TaxID=206335 RepID=A0A9P5PEZ4_9AGAR|nr:hypothetical protein BDP27DRAFT_1368675 [Rhodocollybia butyracea]